MLATYEDVEGWIRDHPYPLSIGVLTGCTPKKYTTLQRAEDLFLGEHHRRLMQGVRAFRDDAGEYLDLRIVSAKYGLLSASTQVYPYAQTFHGKRRKAQREIGFALGLHDGVRAFLEDGSVDLKIVALGADYLEAAGFGKAHKPANLCVILSPMDWAGPLAQWENTWVVPLNAYDTRRFRAGFVGLKGEVARRLLCLAAEVSRTHRQTDACAQ